ncbi:MAG: DMT family transporter [Chloroflexi bacterium]|nr:DMT family transporter [Chloroflexota bacterium]
MDGAGLGAVTFGLLASLSWGASDFSGGLSARRVHVFGVITVSYAVGLALLVALALARSEPIPKGSDLVWGAAAGLAGVTGLTAQYRALAVGRMGIVAPVAAVLGTSIPVLFAAISEGLPGAGQLAGFALAIAGVWIIARPEVSGGRPDGLGLAVLAGLGFGAFFILIDQVSEGAVFWPLVAARGMSFVVLALIVMANSVAWRPDRSALPLVIVAGVLDVGGNTFFLLAAQAGRLDVASVMSSLYPMVTVLLARLVLQEHVTRLQTAGIAAAIAAIPLIAA